ncbi:MAG TPA: PhoH family protein [Salinisphaeraceae bacterium]|nr:PhoH family protein [Salinisphaeraceae bacterium]
MSEAVRQSLELTPHDSERLAWLCGPQDENLRLLEDTLHVEVHNRGHVFQVLGSAPAAQAAIDSIRELYADTARGQLAPDRVHVVARTAGNKPDPATDKAADIVIKTRRGLVRGRGANQRRYLQNLQTYDLNFGIGPAGTGKTYLAVAAAVDALENEQVRRLLLVRPAVEAGEQLGFLPGDLTQKIDPYLRPLYDALYAMLGFERVTRLIERNIIEIAPLAYMRGRTLNEAYIILDEAQNTTAEQMKMFLTRIGFGSTAVVTGDMTQIDLPRHKASGLRNAVRILQGVAGISITRFNSRDVVRHPLVQRIVEAYERDARPAADEAGERQ